MPKILVVDDEVKFRDVICIYLKQEGYEVDTAADGQEALDKFEDGEFDFIILDVMMPKVDGWSVLRKVRDISSVPVIMLTARSEEYDKLFGFELGVDDYVTKPFSPKELVARVKAVMNRYSQINDRNSSEKYNYGEISIDDSSMIVSIAGDEITLTPKEYDLVMLGG
jgi:two-component system response regulator ResD